jgi:hypothetical protein
MFQSQQVLIVFVCLMLLRPNFTASLQLNVGIPTRTGRSFASSASTNSPRLAFTRLFIVPETEGETSSLIADPNAKPQGYMSSDLSSNEDGKQGRVFGYILFALVPVLFLVPFFLSRGFEPPVDPEMTPITSVTTRPVAK